MNDSVDARVSDAAADCESAAVPERADDAAIEQETPGEESAPEEVKVGPVRAGVNLVVDLVRTVATALALSFAVRVIVVEPFHIPSESMEPTLFAGDFVGAVKYPYGWSRVSTSPIPLPEFPGRIFRREARRGDIVMFRNRLDNGQTWVKRIVGLPGDRVQMRAGVLYVNGEAAERELRGSFDWEDPEGRAITVHVYRETLPHGCSYFVQHYDYADGFQEGMDDSLEFLVPPGHYFVMGDNRDASDDSRWPGKLGYIPEEEVIGRAQFVILSLGEGFDLNRPETWRNVRDQRTLKSLPCR